VALWLATVFRDYSVILARWQVRRQEREEGRRKAGGRRPRIPRPPGRYGSILTKALEGVRSVDAVKRCEFAAGHGCEGPQPSKLPATKAWEAPRSRVAGRNG